MPGTFQRHCSQSCMYSDERTWRLQLKMCLEKPWKWHFRDSKFQNFKNLCLWCKFQSCLLFIIRLLLKNFLTALIIGQFQVIKIHTWLTKVEGNKTKEVAVRFRDEHYCFRFVLCSSASNPSTNFNNSKLASYNRIPIIRPP